MRRSALIGAVCSLLAAVPSAQMIQRAPPRDPRSAAPVTGTAVIRGRIIAGDTGKPLRRARIQVTAPELGPEPRSTSTNLDGKYEIKDLPAGRYTISVQRSGYLRLSYGQRRPFEASRPLQLNDRQVAENVNFTLPHMSLITGRVFDEANEAMPGVRVMAMKEMFFEGRRKLVPIMGGGPGGSTDDAGQYRVSGLPPGNYYIRAETNETWTVGDGENQQVMAYAPTYYPGVTRSADGKRVSVGLGQEASNIDLSLIPGRTATVSGTAVDSQGRPLAARSVTLRQGMTGPGGFAMFMMGAQASVGADGTFTFKNVQPGEYQLMAGTTVERDGTSIPEAGLVPVSVNSADVTDIYVTTSAGWSISGTISTENADVPSVPRDRVRVTGKSLDADTNPGSLPMPPPPPSGAASLRFQGGVVMIPDNGRVRDDGTFTVGNLFGPSQIRVVLPDGWTVKSILLDGRDVTDAPVEAKSGESVSGLQVVVTNRVTSVTGQLMSDKGLPLEDGTIILFANDPAKWVDESRFVRSTRPDQEGKYQIRGLPAGEYLAVAVDYVEEGMWNDAEYLDSLRRFAQKLTLNDAESKAIELKITTP